MQFRKDYMMELVTKYVKEKFNIKDLDTSIIKQRVAREEKIKEVAESVTSVDRGTNVIEGSINKILEYIDVDLDEKRVSVTGNCFWNMSVRNIIRSLYFNLINSVNKLVGEIENINFKSEVSEELKIELMEWKKDQISRIYSLLDNEELKELLEKCNLRIPDNKSFVA